MSEVSKTADKVLAVLLELRDGGYSSPQQIAKRLGINRTVTQRLLTTLLARGYVEREDGEYALSRRIATLADAVQHPLRRAVEPVIADLSRQTQETVVFQVLDGRDVIVVCERYWSRRTALQARHEVGSRNPATANATGLAILAALPPQRLERYLTDAVDPSLSARIEEVARTGYALTADELQDGVSGLAVAVRSTSGVFGGLGVLVPTPRMEQLLGYRGPLERAVRAIESELV